MPDAEAAWRASGGAVERFVGERIEALTARNRRALEDNPEAQELLAGAVRDALRGGWEGWLAENDGAALAVRDDPWEGWSDQRWRSPEGLGWPRLAPDAARRAGGDALVRVGDELGITAGGAGRRFARLLGEAGEETADAGAALAESLTLPELEPDEPPAAPVRGDVAGEPVRVAMADNQAVAELMQGRLREAGIPSDTRRAGPDLPHLLAAGPRDIYVPEAAAERARALLAPVEGPREPDVAATRTVGTERAWVRVTGKLVAAFTAAGGLLAIAWAVSGVGRVVALVATVVVFAGILVWSERAGVLR